MKVYECECGERIRARLYTVKHKENGRIVEVIKCVYCPKCRRNIEIYSKKREKGLTSAEENGKLKVRLSAR